MTLVLVAWTATPAEAQWLAGVQLAANVAGDAEFRRGGPGGSFAYLGDRLGLELDVQRYHHFFKDSEIAPLDPAAAPNCMPGVRGPCTDINTDAMSFVGNVVASLPLGTAGSWRPYALAGIGLFHAWFENMDRRNEISQTDAAFGVGAGVMRRLSGRVGLRGDLRYHRALVDESAREGGYYEDYGFLRVTVGVSFRIVP